jgi:pantoate--beta-alanine ligase
MGCLHEGHLSLARLSKKENDLTVVSIFVNPLQFGPREDFKRYPRDLKSDLAMLRKENVDVVWAPDAKHFYPSDFQTEVQVKRLSLGLCGAARPIHFAGVATVVCKLLNGVGPDRLYLGQKDYQQFRVLSQMIKDLDFPVKVRMAPIVREKDGLAMSSRNRFLSVGQRRQAVCLHEALQKALGLVKQGRRQAPAIKKSIRQTLQTASLARVDYVEIVDAQSLQPVVKLKAYQRILIALAVFFGKTRLIDNVLVKVPA